MELTRRNFLTGTTLGAVGAMATTATLARADEVVVASYVSEQAWNAEYDIVIVGFGGAGGSAAIEAADLGCKVLIIDKCMKGLHGGNTRYCGQGICVPQNGAEQFATYFKALRGYFETPSDAIIDAFATKAEETPAWLEHLGVDLSNVLIEPSAGEFKEWPGGGGSDAQAGPTTTYRCSQSTFDGAFYKVITDGVDARSDLIDVWYSCQAKHLLQDPETKVVHGVQFEHDGELYNVRARNGVIMACGGYENNQQMQQDYLLIPQTTPYGSVYNTGDGIDMAVEVGARLWHMGNQAGPLWCFKGPECEHGLTNLMGVTGQILVGPDGTRFMCESGMNRHGHLSEGGRYNPQPTTYPAYIIMDSAYLSSKEHLYPSFSAFSVDEIAAGYFIVGNTIEELADKIYEDMPDFARLPNYTENMGSYTERLVNTVETWNASVEAGVDAEFGRTAQTMSPISEPPFYALKQDIMMFNTQGSPERDELARVIDMDGNPIPHLYSAGEFGAIWSDIYNGGCNLAECITFGRIAAEQCATTPEDAVLDTLCQDPVSFPVEEIELPELGENEYLGVGHGIGGKLYVVATIADGSVTDIKVVYSMETPGIGSKAVSNFPGMLVEAAGEPVDAINGATVSCRAIADAVMDCMAQAGMDTNTNLLATVMSGKGSGGSKGAKSSGK